MLSSILYGPAFIILVAVVAYVAAEADYAFSNWMNRGGDK